MGARDKNAIALVLMNFALISSAVEFFNTFSFWSCLAFIDFLIIYAWALYELYSGPRIEEIGAFEEVEP